MTALRLSPALRLGSLRLFAVERVEVTHLRGGAVALLEPCALVVQDGARAYALDLDGASLPLDRLLDDVPDLRGALASGG